MGIECRWVAICDRCKTDGRDKEDRLSSLIKDFLQDDINRSSWLQRPDQLLCPPCADDVLEEEDWIPPLEQGEQQ